MTPRPSSTNITRRRTRSSSLPAILKSRKRKAWVEKYFAGIPRKKPSAIPDLTEPKQDRRKDRHPHRQAGQASRPSDSAIKCRSAAARSITRWACSTRSCCQGEDSMLYQELVKNKNYTSGLSGGINGYLGNMFNYNGPMLFSVDLIHDRQIHAARDPRGHRRGDRAGAEQAGSIRLTSTARSSSSARGFTTR